MTRTLFVWTVLTVAILAPSMSHAQYLGHAADDAEKVHSNLVTPISSGQTVTNTSPFKVAITVGTGQYFKKILDSSRVTRPACRMWLTCYPPTTGYAVENTSSPIEVFECSAVSNDTLTLTARKLSNTTNTQWNAGAGIAYRLLAYQFEEVWDSLNALKAGGAGLGTVTSIHFNAPLTGGTITTTGTVGIPQATSGANGYLTSTDWTTFNNKLSSFSATSPVTFSGGVVAIPQASGIQSGYLASADWVTFNGKMPYADSTGHAGQVWTDLPGGGLGWASLGTGTVTSVNVTGGLSGLSLSGGPVVNSGTISISGGALNVGFGGTGAATAAGGLNNLLPNQSGHSGNVLTTDGTGTVTWGSVTSTGGVTKSPATTSANIIKSTTDTAVELSIHGKAGQFANLFEIYDNDSSGYFIVDTGGNVTASGSVTWVGGQHLTGNLMVDGTTDTHGIGNFGTILNDGSFHETGTSQFTGDIEQFSGAASFTKTSVQSLTSMPFDAGAFYLAGDSLVPYHNTYGFVTTAAHTLDYSPSIYLIAHGWNTTATAHDSEYDGRVTFLPTTGSTVTGKFSFATGNTGIGFTERMSLTSAGALNLPTGGVFTVNGANVLTGSTLGSGVTSSSLTSLGTLTSLSMGGPLNLTAAIDLHVSGSQTTTYTATTSDCTIPCDATGGAFAVTLTASPTLGQLLIISKIDASGNAVTVSPNSGQSYVAGTVSLASQGSTVTLIYIGSNKWLKVAVQ